nr:MAG TPA: Thymidylate synthase thyX [Caudoviricetes sp.]
MEFKIENLVLAGINNSFRASGNPMRTEIRESTSYKDFEEIENDLNRCKKLGNSPIGSGHDNFLKGCIVQFDLYAPLYMWKQIQRYHFIEIISSQSTMHRLTKFDVKNQCTKDTDKIILERYEELLNEYKENPNDEKWRTLVASLPCGFILGATISTNYQQLKTIYYQRKNHKLKEWREFCSFIKSLPYAEVLFIEKNEKNE